MIDALISGRLFGKPVERTSRNGNAFATAKLRVAMRDGESVFVNCIAFSRSCAAALLALEDGDSAALSGELKVGIYQGKDGTWRPSLDLTAHVAMTEYHVSRKRKAVRGNDDAPPEPNGAAPLPAPATDPEFNDDIDF